MATVGMPFAGQWAYNANVNPDANGNYSDATSSHPSVHAKYYGDWATDLYAPAGTAVHLNVTSPDGPVTFSYGFTNDTCSSAGANIAGHGVVINVFVGTAQVGSIDYEHLDNISTGPYTNGMTIGTITTEPLAGAPTYCYTVRHTHVELKNSTTGTYACWTDNGHPGVQLGSGVPIGILGSGNTGQRQACSTTGSGSPTTPPYTPNLCDTIGIAVLANCPEAIEEDVNGDGLTDLVHLTGSGVDTWLSTGWGGYNVIRTGFLPFVGYGMSGCIKWEPGDFNGDGKSDLACIWSGGIDTWFSNGDGTYAYNGTYTVSGYGMTGCSWFVGDFNADAKSDFACEWSGGIDTWFSNGNGTYNVHTTYGVAGYSMGGCKWYTGRFTNANMRTDFVCIWSGGVDTWFSNGDGTYSVSSTYIPWSNYNMTAGFYWKVADVTGTGVDSLLYFWSGGVDTWRSWSSGVWTVTTQSAPPGYTMQGGNWQFGDFTGDGKTDIVNINNNGVDTWISNGLGAYNVVTVGQKPPGYNMTAGITYTVGRVTNTNYDSILHVWSGGVNTWLAYGYGSDGTWYVPGTYLTPSGYNMTGGAWY